MTVSLKHAFTSNVADSGDATLVQPSNWNAEHNLTANANSLLGTVTAGSVTEISCTSAGRDLLDDADAAAQRATLAAAGTDVTNTFTANQIVSVTDNTNAAIRITQLGTGNALLVEDSANPDATPTVIAADGTVVVGYTAALDTDNYAGTQITPKVQVQGINNQTSTLSATAWAASTGGPQIALGKSRSATVGTNTVVQSGDVLGAVTFAGDDGTAIIIGASILGESDGTPGTNDMPGRLVFSTTADGAQTATERLRISSTGAFGISGANYGSANQVLISGGSAAAPSWSSGTFSGTSSGTNTGDQNIFQTIAVSGQSNVVADSTADTLTLVAGTNIALTTNATADSITISTSGLGTIATQNANNVSITGGSITGITDLAVADGGTGASTLTGYVKGNGTAAFTASSTIPNADVSGLGTAATQNTGTSGATIPFCNGTNTWANAQTFSLGGTFDATTTAVRVSGGTPSSTGRVIVGGISAGNTTSTVGLETITASTALRYHFVLTNGNGVVGSISTNASATAYTTSSDYRLKENIEPISNASHRVSLLNPVRFNWISDPGGPVVDGFIAHEVQSVVPEAITGQKDEVNPEDGRPVFQGIDQSKLVPLLAAALKEAIGEIADLKARVSALEGA